jgi:hypothetical protein
MTIPTESPPEKPAVLKRSRAKIWMRTGIFVFFTAMFSFMLYEDISQGIFPLWAIAIIFLPAVGFGFWMSRFVPMQVHTHHQHVTFSFDRVYFILIWALVIVKAVAGRLPHWEIVADVLMVTILGIMSGRLGGIGLRVRGLKDEHGFRKT